MNRTYRIGIVGIGAIANMHARAIGDLTNAELVGGTCRTETKGRAFAEEYNCRWYADFHELYEKERPDVVTIATPSGVHVDPTVAAAERGIHVLVEKPIEIALDRADRMIDAAAKGGVSLGGFFPQRFNPVVRAVHDAAAEGRFGTLAIANAYVPWWRDDAYYSPDRWQGTLALDGGGAVINQSIHAIDAMQWVAEAAGSGGVEQVFAFTAQRGHDPSLIEVEDTATAALRYRNGALGLILAATSMYPGTSQRFHIAGRDGAAEVHENQLVGWQFREEQDDDEATRRRFGGGGEAGGASDPMAIGHANHTRNIAHFLESLDAGRKPLIDGPEARKTLAIIEALYRSATTGQPAILE